MSAGRPNKVYTFKKGLGGKPVKVDYLHEFCLHHDLNYHSMSAVGAGRQVSHKGWMLADGPSKYEAFAEKKKERRKELERKKLARSAKRLSDEEEQFANRVEKWKAQKMAKRKKRLAKQRAERNK